MIALIVESLFRLGNAESLGEGKIKRGAAAFCGLLVFLATEIAVGPELYAAAEEAPAAMLRPALEQVLSVAFPESGSEEPEATAKRVRSILDRTMDFESITRRAMGRGWREFSASEQARAVELFSSLVVRTYTDRFVGKERPKIEYKPAVALGPERWEVTTVVKSKGFSYEVVYRLEKRPNGWRVYDVVAEGVSLVSNYRAQFAALFQKGGAAAVLRALESKQTEEPAEQS